MKPKFRFRIGGDTSISDPIGWKDVVLNLERDLDYHSLIENIDTPYEFYGRTASKDGGYARLKQARDNGPDSQVTILAQVSWDGGTNYDTFFNGMFDLTTLNDVGIRGRRKFQCTILRDDFWAKFINRKATPVDVRSAIGIDGQTVSVVSLKTLNLPSQEVRYTFDATHIDSNISYTAGAYGNLDWETETLNEIETKYQLPRITTSTLPVPLFVLKWAGNYQVDAKVVLSTGAGFAGGGLGHVAAGVDVQIQINSAAATSFTRTNLGATPGVNMRTEFTYSSAIAFNKSDEIRIYITAPDGACVWLGLVAYNSFLTIVADTTYADTTTEALPIHDTGHSICNRIIGRENTFYSEYFGGTSETARTYAADGCGLNFLTMLGLHVRGFTWTAKPYSQSFDEWWECWNKIFNLALGYEYVGTTQVIRVEEKEHFYDSSSNSIILEGVNGIEISYDPDYFYTSVKIGFERWNFESKSGLDDPQTIHDYSTRIKTLGTNEKKDLRILSKAYAASLGIEQTRRNNIYPSNNWALDEEFMVIQSDLSTSPAEPELYSAAVISGLENADTRYNVRLTPASNLNRWKTFLANGFSNYPGDFFRFVRGEGNTDMVYNDPAASGCDAEAGKFADESGDILIGGTFLFTAVLYTFTHPLTWNQYKGVRDNPKKSISVRYYDNDGVQQQAIAFVKKLAYKPNKSKADFQVWIKSVAPV